MKTKELFFLFLAFLFIILQHSYYFQELYYDHDVAGYAYNTAEVLSGKGWYASIWYNKPPGISFLYIPAFLILGKSFMAIRIIAMLANILSAFILFLLGKHLLRETTKLYFLLPVIYALFCISIDPVGHGINLETFMAIFEISGILFLGLAYKKRIDFFYFLAGLMLGLAFMIKPAAIITVIAAVAFMMVSKIIEKENLRIFIYRFFILLISFFIPLGLMSVFFLSQHVLDKFIYYSFVVPYQHGGNMLKDVKAFLIYKSIWGIMSVELFVFEFFALTGILYSLFKRCLVNILFLLWFFVCLWLAAFSPYPHYFIQFIPSFACLSVIGSSYIYLNIKHKYIKILFYLLFATPFLYNLYLPERIKNIDYLINIKQTNKDRFLSSLYIKSHANFKDKLFVWDDLAGCSIYFWTGLENVSNYRVKYSFLPKNLMRASQRALAGDYKINQNNFLSDLDKRLPEYIVIAEDNINDYLYGLERQKNVFPGFFNILKNRYKIDKKIGICIIYKLI